MKRITLFAAMAALAFSCSKPVQKTSVHSCVEIIIDYNYSTEDVPSYRYGSDTLPGLYCDFDVEDLMKLVEDLEYQSYLDRRADLVKSIDEADTNFITLESIEEHKHELEVLDNGGVLNAHIKTWNN
jgi:hypothetical protein